MILSDRSPSKPLRAEHCGVRDASVSEHALATSDGLTLRLTRFLRRPCGQAVILTHGLTSSRSMFTMAEHVNIVAYLLDEGFTDVWILDWRGSSDLPYNRGSEPFTLDDVALIDIPEAIQRVRAEVGPGVSLHFVAHCLGSLAVGMSLAAGLAMDLTSVVGHGVFLTPRPPPATMARILGLTDALSLWFKDGYLPMDSRELGLRSRALPYFLIAAATRGRCRDQICQALNFTYGSHDSVFRHDNLHPDTHARLHELFGPLPFSYIKHLRSMALAGRAVKMRPRDSKYDRLPDDYLAELTAVRTPILLLVGDENRMWGQSNAVCHEVLTEQLGREQVALQSVAGYGHQDVFIGRSAALDVFPLIGDFLRAHSG